MSEVVSGVIESLDNFSAIIKLSSGQKISWPLVNLPSDCQIGTKVNISISKEEGGDGQKDELAKRVINDFLKK